jgi:hypothetical protein
MINHFRKFIFSIVLIGYSCAFAGSYDDFFGAIRQDDPSAVAALLQRGFDPNTVDPQGTSGLMLALKLGSMKVVQALVQAPGVQVEVRNKADESPLMLAALRGDLALCQSLIDKGADVNKPGWAPLHYAATNGHLEVMNLLLEASAYIDAESPNGTTPLMMAAHYGTASAVKLLLEAGADPSLKNEQGLDAIAFAQRARHTEAAEIIAAFIRGRQPQGSW